MQTPYGAISYQTPTSGTANHSEHSFADCYWLHTRYKHSTSIRQNQSPSNGHPSQTSCYSTETTDSNTNHPLRDLNAYLNLPRNRKATIFHNNEHINIIILKPYVTPEECRENFNHIHTIITSQYLSF